MYAHALSAVCHIAALIGEPSTWDGRPSPYLVILHTLV